MKQIIIGVLIGAILTGLAGFLAMPEIKKTAYDTGFQEGTKGGITQGTAAGITQGIAQVKEEQRLKHQQDSTTAAKKYQEAKRRAAIKPVEKPKPIQNWHVIDGKIDEPIPPAAPPAPETKAK